MTSPSRVKKSRFGDDRKVSPFSFSFCPGGHSFSDQAGAALYFSFFFFFRVVPLFLTSSICPITSPSIRRTNFPGNSFRISFPLPSYCDIFRTLTFVECGHPPPHCSMSQSFIEWGEGVFWFFPSPLWKNTGFAVATGLSRIEPFLSVFLLNYLTSHFFFPHLNFFYWTPPPSPCNPPR